MLRVVALSRNHDRAGFECGIPELDAFLRTVARQHAEKGVSRTFGDQPLRLFLPRQTLLSGGRRAL